MGELILFRPRKGRNQNGMDLSKPSSADIMLFTGVRYERMVDPAPQRESGDHGAPSDGVGGGRKRKRG